jgi:hypothetical protein
MFARLVTGRYGRNSDEGPHSPESPRDNWLRRAIAALFSRKR